MCDALVVLLDTAGLAAGEGDGDCGGVIVVDVDALVDDVDVDCGAVVSIDEVAVGSDAAGTSFRPRTPTTTTIGTPAIASQPLRPFRAAALGTVVLAASDAVNGPEARTAGAGSGSVLATTMGAGRGVGSVVLRTTAGSPGPVSLPRGGR